MKISKILQISLSAILFVCLFVAAVEAKYCQSCGTYNSDLNTRCIKCGQQFPDDSSKKMKVGVFFLSYMHPGDKARFTIFNKSKVTPFYVWNPKGRYEIGETLLPTWSDVEFISIPVKEPPTGEQITEYSNKYSLDRSIVIQYSSKQKDRVPIFSSQTLLVNLDLSVYTSDGKATPAQRRYEASMKGWPTVGILYVTEITNSLWGQMVSELRGLL